MKKTLLLVVIAVVASFTTFAQTTILSVDFEGTGTPSGWTTQNISPNSGWKFGTTTALSSSYFTIPAHTKVAAVNDDACDTCNNSNAVLISPAMNFSTFTKVFMNLDIFFGEGSYNGKIESAKIEVSTDGGSTFTVLQQLTGQAAWYTLELDLSAYAGQPSVVVAFRYNDDGDWLFGWAIDNFKVYEPAQIDAGVTSVNLVDYVAINTPQTITGSLKNFGASNITTLDLNYSVNGGPTVTQSIGGLNIASLGAYSYSHSTTWTPTATGSYSIKVWTSNINSGTDQNAANDSSSKTVVVVAQTVPHVCLFEQFTSSTCAPCAAEAPFVNALLNANNTNNPGTNVVAIKYQMNWPSPGNDPSYNPDGNTRKSYYGVTGIPYFSIDGKETADDQPSIDAALVNPAIMDIDLSYVLNGNTVDVTAIVTSFASISATTKLHIGVIEDYYNYPGAATSQKDYYYVQRKMLPNGNGTTISPLTEGVAKTTTQSYTFTVANPPAQGSYNLWVGTGNVSVVAFVQDNTSKKIFQAAIAPFPTGLNDQEINTSVNLYPNPTSGLVSLDITMINSDILDVSVYDMLGAAVYQDKIQGNGNFNTYLDLSGLSNGMYSINIKNSSGGSVTRKLILDK